MWRVYSRPVGAEAFAPAGRWRSAVRTQGVALGWLWVAPSGRMHTLPFLSFLLSHLCQKQRLLFSYPFQSFASTYSYAVNIVFLCFNIPSVKTSTLRKSISETIFSEVSTFIKDK